MRPAGRPCWPCGAVFYRGQAHHRGLHGAKHGQVGERQAVADQVGARRQLSVDLRPRRRRRRRGRGACAGWWAAGSVPADACVRPARAHARVLARSSARCSRAHEYRRGRLTFASLSSSSSASSVAHHVSHCDTCGAARAARAGRHRLGMGDAQAVRQARRVQWDGGVGACIAACTTAASRPCRLCRRFASTISAHLCLLRRCAPQQVGGCRRLASQRDGACRQARNGAFAGLHRRGGALSGLPQRVAASQADQGHRAPQGIVGDRYFRHFCCLDRDQMPLRLRDLH